MTTICEILNDPIVLSAIDKILAPSNSNTEKGSFLIAKALTLWSNNTFTPVMWSSKEEPDYWGVEATLTIATHNNWDVNKYKERSIFMNPKSAGVEGEQMLVKIKNIGWPNYSTKLSGSSRLSNAGKHPKWTQVLTEKQNKIIQNILSLINNTVQFSNNLDSILVLKPDTSKTYSLGDTLFIKGAPHRCTNVVWPIYKHSPIISDRWPTDLTNHELLNYLNQSVNTPFSIKCLVTNLKWYKRLNKNIEWGPNEWASLDSIIRDTIKNEDKITQQSVRAIKNIPGQFQHLYVKHLYENEGALNIGSHMVEYIRDSGLGKAYEIDENVSIIDVLTNNNQYSSVASIMRISRDILAGTLKPNTLWPNSLEHIITSIQTYKHDGKLCILKAMYQMDWHTNDITKDYFPTAKCPYSANIEKLRVVCPWLLPDKDTDYYLLSIDKMDIRIKVSCTSILYGMLHELQELDEDALYNDTYKIKQTFNRLSTVDKHVFFKIHQDLIQRIILRTEETYTHLRQTGKYINYPDIINQLYTIFDPELPTEQTNTLKLFYDNKLDQFREGWKLKLASDILKDIKIEAIDYDLI